MTRFSPWLKSECVAVEAMSPPKGWSAANDIDGPTRQLLGETRLGNSLGALLETVADQLRGGMDAQLAHDARAVILDRLGGHPQLARGDAVGLAVEDRVEYLPLARAERGDVVQSRAASRAATQVALERVVHPLPQRLV